MRQLFAHARADLPAGLVVFLVALPLCLGIALASGAPLFSGLVAGIVGGLVVGALSASRLSVSGPAAGLTAIVLSAIASLGGFQTFLLAVFLAGVLQLVAAALRTGTIANYIPSSVIKGMLTAIGIIIILKQIPHAFGYDQDTEGDLAFFQPDGETTFTALLQPLWHIDVGAALIAAVGLAVLILWERPFMRRFQFVPGPLVAVFSGVLMNELFKLSSGTLALAAEHLVQVPVLQSWSDAAALFIFPDFSQLLRGDVWLVAVTIAAVATLESLLCIEAVDKLDPEKHVTPTNRELYAQGAGNIACGLLGGLPVTSVIVRSSANVTAGARTKLSALFHGLLLLVSVLLFPTLLNRIPLASLAAVLLVVGYKLAKPSIFKEMLRHGKYQAIPFFVTVVAILFTDLLVGVGIGLLAAIFGILRGNMKSPYYFHRTEHHAGDVIKVELSPEVSFLNKASVLMTLEHLPPNSTVHLDASRTKYIDYDVLEVIREFVHVRAPQRGIKTLLIEFKERYELGDGHHVRVRTLDKPGRDAMTPVEVLEALRAGNRRFMASLRLDRDLLQQANDTSEGQHPMAVIVGCIDSRTSPSIIFDQGLGDIFSVRLAGNVVTDEVLGSVEFGCKVAGAKLVVVLGHTQCGAVKGACGGLQLGYISRIVELISPAVRSIVPEPSARYQDDLRIVDAVAHNNAVLAARELIRRSPILAEMSASGEVLVVAGMYDLHTGHAALFAPDELLPRLEPAPEPAPSAA